MTTGVVKRFWGAHGNKPDDADNTPYIPGATPSKQFGNPVHCAMLADDGLVYVTDGKNEKVYILDRQSLDVITSFGDGGRQPGQFFGAHSIATDSKGNIDTTETYEGRRLQKFTYKGLASVARLDQGTVWPK